MSERKIVHLFKYEKFTSKYVNMVHENFDPSEHKFFIYGYNEAITMNIADKTGVEMISSLHEVFADDGHYKELLSSDKIIVHALFLVDDYYGLADEIYAKMYILFWGGDIYDYVRGSFSLDIRNIFKRKKRLRKKADIIKKVKGVITLIEGDYEILKKYVEVPEKHFVGKYISLEVRETCDKNRNNEKGINPYYVLVGNSASPNNRHINIIKKLYRFRNENVRFLFPLSYGGGKRYRKLIGFYGRHKLGRAFCPITKLMPYEKYVAMLSKCSAGIFNNDRQQAMGNINALAYLGAKIYIRNDTAMWGEFINNLGYNFFDIDSIGQLSFNELVEVDPKDARNNINKYIENNTADKFVELWKKIFEDV